MNFKHNKYNSLSDEEQIREINWCVNNIEYISNPTEAVQLAAVYKYAPSLALIKNPSEAVQIAAVRQDGFLIKIIGNPTEAVKLAAVKRHGCAIEYIPNPSEDVQLAAVRQHGCAIDYINNPSEAVQLAALEKDLYAIQYIENPPDTPDVKKKVLFTILKEIKQSKNHFNTYTYDICKTKFPLWTEWKDIDKSLYSKTNGKYYLICFHP